LQTDPIRFRGQDSNLYRYVYSSSLNYRDPYGKFAITLPVLAISAAIVAASAVSVHYANNPPNIRIPKFTPPRNPHRSPKRNRNNRPPVVPPGPPDGPDDDGPDDDGPDDNENDEDCDEQWRRARQRCEEELAKPIPCPGVTGGHSDVWGCAKGHVTEDCGGTAYNTAVIETLESLDPKVWCK